ncbi:MAG: alpha/beta fold hydrolase BchO [Pseudomonadota bacterium]
MSADLPPDDWPGRAYSRIVPCKPHRWHVQEVGDGPDVLLLHGAGASTHSWARLADILSAHHRVIMVDLPGHGFTRSPKGRARLQDVAQDMSNLARQEGWRPTILVGHSAGAAVALEMARMGRLGPEQIIAINGALEDFQGPAGWLFPMMAKMLALNPLTGFFITQNNPSLAQIRRIIGATGTGLDDDALDLYAQLIRRKSHVDGTLAMMAQWSLSDLNRALPEIGIPTLFLHGTKDQAVSIKVAERAASLMPRGHLVPLEGVGHLAQEEVPEIVANHIHTFAQNMVAE